MSEQRFIRDRQILEMSEIERSVLSLTCYFTWSAEPTGDVCACSFWFMAVLGFRGPLDSESYMPTGVSLKVVDLIGCIRLCVCVCWGVCACVCLCAEVCLCACSNARVWVRARKLNCEGTHFVSFCVCAVCEFLHLFALYMCIFVCKRMCMHLTFSSFKCRGSNSGI